MCYNRSGCFLHKPRNTNHVVDDNDVGCHRSNMCVMCGTSVPTLFQYFFYDHIPTFLYIFHEMFITCNYTSNKKHFLKNVKECRDVIVQKVYKQGRDGSHTSRFDLIAPYIVVAYITVYA